MAALAGGERETSRRPRVGAAHDPAEHRADRIAATLTAPQPPQSLQPLQCTACRDGAEPCPACAASRDGLHRGVIAAAAGAPADGVSPGAGAPLPESPRRKFERRLGIDLSPVRLHTGPAAVAAARGVNAQAFAFGRDIVLGHAAPPLNSHAGERLLAHEVGHTLTTDGVVRRQPSGTGEAPELAIPGSVTIEFMRLAPWYATVQEAGGATASPAAIAVELYGIEAPQLIEHTLFGNAFALLPNLLRPGYRARFDERIAGCFAADVARAETMLFEDLPQRHWPALIEIVRDWSRLHDVRRHSGESWFDAFLGQLARDCTYYDYLVATGSKTSFLDTLFAAGGDDVGTLFALVSRHSERFGLYRPPEALLDPDLTRASVNPALVARAADLVLERLSGVTNRGESGAITTILGGLPPAGQAAVLREIMSRYKQTDWTGLFGRYGERRQAGMLYWLFEDLTKDNRRTLADSLVANEVLTREDADTLIVGRGVVAQYLPYTTDLAIESTQFWARRYEKSSGAGAVFYGLMGGLAVLATPRVVDQTALVLGTAGAGSAVGPVLAARAPTLAMTLTVGGAGLAGFNAGLAIGHLIDGRDANGQPLDDAGRASLALLAVSNLLFATAGVLSLHTPAAAPESGLTRVSPGEVLPPDTGPGAGAGTTINIRLVSFSPESGDMVVAAEYVGTGRYAVVRFNVRTGAGYKIGPNGEISPIENFALSTPRLALPGEVGAPFPANALPTAPTAAPLPAPPPPAGALPPTPSPPLLPRVPVPPLALPSGPLPPLALPAGPRAPLALPGPRYHALPEILPDPGRAFMVPELENAYRAYLAGVRPPDTPASREEWVRLTRYGPRAALVRWLGPNFPTADGEPVYIRLAAIARPASLSDARLADLLGQLQAEPAALGDRYDPGGAAGPQPGEVNLANFNILKGNVGEILARPVRAAIAADLQIRFPGSRIHDGVRIRLPRTDGTLGAPLLFSDGVIAETIGNNLVLRGVVEVKAGSTGGQAATEQIFEWNEGRIEPGAQLLLRDGRAFAYDPARTVHNPDGTQAPRAIFLLAAGRHLIAPIGAENLGEGSSMGIGPAVQRYTLPANAEEINFLTRLMAERLAATTAPVIPAPAQKP